MTGAIDGFNGATKFSATPYRALRHFLFRGGEGLRSVVFKHRFHEGENVAECQAQDFYWDVPQPGAMNEPEPAPEHDMATCACGFYAYHGPEFDQYGHLAFAGIVECYGEVIVGSKGLRATKLRIVALITPPGEPRPSRLPRATMWDRLAGHAQRRAAAVATWYARRAAGAVIAQDELDALRIAFPSTPIFHSLADALDLFPLSGAPESEVAE